jgi:hypothetical protein
LFLKLEHLASLWLERQNLGASYSAQQAALEKHIVVIATSLQYDIIFDFLNEFYAHRKNQVKLIFYMKQINREIRINNHLHSLFILYYYHHLNWTYN